MSRLKARLRGRELSDDDPNHSEQFLRYTGLLLVFSADTELEVLHLFPHPQAWAEFRSATESYLDHCGHMLGL